MLLTVCTSCSLNHCALRARMFSAGRHFDCEVAAASQFPSSGKVVRIAGVTSPPTAYYGVDYMQ